MIRILFAAALSLLVASPAAGQAIGNCPYLGGKRNLAQRLCAIIAAIPHRTYVEPFIGMGGVFLRRAERPPVEVMNDISADVANLFRVVRKHHAALEEELGWLLASRDEFDRQRRVDPETLTDIERAARFIYLQRLAFGGKVTARSFGTSTTGPARFNLSNLRDDLLALHRRLEPVTIERLPYWEVIERYDSPDTCSTSIRHTGVARATMARACSSGQTSSA
ncbi:DNA adenine methylase [Sphingomonas yunnanensis]|uniref:DNA adenine methylase n=1 Tax=Sphingomonas yunnanensis TaxID=310400 RepID=UPI0031BBC62F